MNRIPLSLTKRVEKALKISGELSSCSLIGDSIMLSFAESLASPRPLPLPADRGGNAFDAAVLALGSCDTLWRFFDVITQRSKQMVNQMTVKKR